MGDIRCGGGRPPIEPMEAREATRGEVVGGDCLAYGWCLLSVFDEAVEAVVLVRRAA